MYRKGQWFLLQYMRIVGKIYTVHIYLVLLLLNRHEKLARCLLIAILRYFPLISLSENFPSHASRVRWKIIASN
jgi:hypothetical protein